MISSSACLGDNELMLLRRLIGHRIPWIYGTPFFVERDLLVATRVAIPTGYAGSKASNDACLGFGSERFETQDLLDYACFRIGIAESLGCALGTTGSLYVDTSALVDIGQGIVQNIVVLSSCVDDRLGEICYDAVIRFEFNDGLVLSLGHAPGVYEGVCLTRSESVTLGNPKMLRERIKL